jgi:cytochrome c-type biogenesis protein
MENVWLAIGLGLLGFIEPCTVGGHIYFLGLLLKKYPKERLHALLSFIITRSLMTGLFGGVIAFFGQKLLSVQTKFWLIFGMIYLILGVIFIVANLGRRIDLAPNSMKSAQHPVVLGFAVGLNIPACAAPILFSLLGLSATLENISEGFLLMFFFGLFLSLPLGVIVIFPRLAEMLRILAVKMKQLRWLVGMVFILLGVWSIWFGLYVEPANWAGQ